MIKVDVTRNLIGLEDLLVGVGTVNQTRGGSVVSMTRINGSNMPYDDTFSMGQKFDALQLQIDNLPQVVDEGGNLLTGLINTSSLALNLAGRLWRRTISGTEARIYYGTELLFTYNPSTGGLILPSGTDYIAADAVVTANYIAADTVVNNARIAAINALVASLGTAAYVNTGTGANQIVKLDGSAKLPAVDGSQLTNLVGIVPVGGVIACANSTVPTGFLECNGAAIDRTTYAALFTAIGTTYGVGNGSTTFNIPDLRGEFLRGWDNSRGIDTGRVIGSTQTDEVESHLHSAGSIITNTIGAHSHTYPIDGNGSAGSGTPYLMQTNLTPAGANASSIAGDHSHTTSGNTASTGGSETRPRNIAMMYIIKT